MLFVVIFFFFFKQKTADEMRISDWSSDVCSSDLVLGRIEDVDKIAPEVAAKLIVIAMPSIDAAAMRRVVEACERTGLPFRTVPRLDDLLEGRSLTGELKEVAIEDLLGRQPITPGWE